jgi:hypothetical protein
MRSVDWGSISFEATMRAWASSWIWRILEPPLPMTEPIKRCEMRRRIEADADGETADASPPLGDVADGTGFSRIVCATRE